MHLNWDFPYSSRRAPVFARNVVAASQPLAAQAGLHMLRSGGNAVDAALAAAIALTVVEPCSNGIGSDAFALVWDGREMHGLNGSGRAPANWSPQKFKDVDCIGIGWDSITVPGAVDTWAVLSERFGRLPFNELFAPAIRYAAQGFAVSPIVQRDWASAIETYSEFTGFRKAFMRDGRAPEVGELFKHPEQAQTLTAIAETKGRAFYEGDLALKMTTYLNENGCELSREDMARHVSEWVEPIAINYGAVSVQQIPPNGQGIAALIALGILDQLDLAQYPVDSADSVHLQIEATKIGLRLAHEHVADPTYMRTSVGELLDKAVLARCAADIDLGRAGTIGKRSVAGGTVYLCTADAGGMMVSFIQSNYWGFGSGIVVPGTGISLQNRAAGFSLEEGHPNAAEGGKRPFHTIIPGFVLREGAPLLSFGVMGAHMQAQGHVQMITRIFDYGQNPQAASDAPRWYIDERGDLVFEAGFDAAVVRDLLERRGHALSAETPRFSFGGAQLIYRLDNGAYCAASDHRKDGLAVGY